MHQDCSVVLEALRAYDCLGKRIIMRNRQNLTKTQIEVLLTLRPAGQVSMTRLSELLGVSKEQTSRATAPLVDAGLVEKKRNALSHRMVEIRLTDEGKRSLDALEALHKNDLEEELDKADPEDVAKLIDTSQKASELLWRILEATE